MKSRIKNILKRVFKAISIQEVRVLPGHLAYFFFVSLVPMITVAGLFAGLFNIDLQVLAQLINDAVPKDIAEIIVPFITTSKWSWGATLSILIAFFLASNATHALIITSNTLFHIDQTSELDTRIKAFFMTFLIIFLLFFIIIILGFGDMILSFIFSIGILKNASNFHYILISILKWPVAFFFIFYIVKLIFTIAPDAKIPSKHMTNGALFTSVSWMIATFIYSFYVNNIANYSALYGSLASIVMTLVWIYFLSYLFVIGVAINVGYYFENKNEKSTQDNNATDHVA